MKGIKMVAGVAVFVCAASCQGYAALPVLSDAGGLSSGDIRMIMDDGWRPLMRTFFERREKGKTLRLPPAEKIDWQEYLETYEAQLQVLRSA
ncbi:MAG: hypothetical protein ABIA77_02960 [Candidatus Omnitrophota bacterium]